MGLFNTVVEETPQKCPICGETLGTDWETKDLSDRCNRWDVGDRIVIGFGDTTFKCDPFDAVWEGWNCQSSEHRRNCGASIICDIIIKDGVICEITNLRKYDFNKWKESIESGD